MHVPNFLGVQWAPKVRPAPWPKTPRVLNMSAGPARLEASILDRRRRAQDQSRSQGAPERNGRGRAGRNGRLGAPDGATQAGGEISPPQRPRPSRRSSGPPAPPPAKPRPSPMGMDPMDGGEASERPGDARGRRATSISPGATMASTRHGGDGSIANVNPKIY